MEISKKIVHPPLGEGSSLRRVKSKRPRLRHVWIHAFNPTGWSLRRAVSRKYSLNDILLIIKNAH
jgi:hypothetical protein